MNAVAGPGGAQVVTISRAPRAIIVAVRDAGGTRPYAARRRASGAVTVYPAAPGDWPSRELRDWLAEHPAVLAALAAVPREGV